MSLALYLHPLASFCWKPLIAFYENGTPFEPVVVDLGDPEASAAFRKISPMLKIPVLRDEARDRTIRESTTIVEYLDAYYPGETRFVPADADQAWPVRMWDRFYDHYVQEPMQKIVTDGLRPEETRDAYGVEHAKAQLYDAYAAIEQEMAARPWAMGEAFTLVDCAAAPALFYANIVAPIGREHGKIAAYLGRLMQRPSYMRVLDEARPWFRLFPLEEKLRSRYPALLETDGRR